MTPTFPSFQSNYYLLYIAHLCEVHGFAYDEEWTVETAEVPNREAAGMVMLALADYVFEV